MSLIVWNGSSVDWADTGNWVGAAIPTTSDDILFDGTSVQDVTTNVDRSGDGNWGTARTITVMPSFTGSIGGTGSPLKMNHTGTLSYKGGTPSDTSEFWFESVHATGVLEAKLAPAGRHANACRIDGKFIDVDCLRGKIQFEVSATILTTGSLRLISDPNLGGTPFVDVPNGATVTGSEAFVLDGELISDVAWPMLVICANGKVQHSITTAATIAEIIQGGGEFVSDKGTVTLYHIYGGRFDGASYAQWVVTTMHAMREAQVDLRNGAGLEPATLNEHAFTSGRIWRD